MQAEEPFENRPRPRLPDSPLRSARVPLLVCAFAIGLVMFLALEPTQPWILLVLTAVVAVGTDGILREHGHAADEEDVAWTAPLLFLPTLLVLGAGLFLEDALSGYWVVPGVVIAAGLLAAVLYAEYISIDSLHVSYAGARFVLNIGTYLAAFALYAVVYAFDVSLLPAALIVGLVSLLLAVEILREAEADPVRMLVFAAVIGLVVAEARWALYFLPLESYLAGVFLLVVFYVASGLVQHHLNDDLHAAVLAEFAAMAGVGVVIVTLGRIFEAGA
jgi:hypothetical protein